MTKPRTLHASIDPSLLREIPRFFGSFEAALTELFQNTGRAGAGSVTVTYEENEDRLTIEDDGRGIAHPQVLLTAGQSGWPTGVIDPAGIGFFAHLAYVEKTVVVSRTKGKGWTLTLTPGVLQGEPAVWEALDQKAAGEEDGTRIEMRLGGQVSYPHPEGKTGAVRQAIRKARGLQPFQVTFNGETIDPYWMGTILFELDTSVGRLVLVDDMLDRRARRPVWENRWIDSAHFASAVQAAIDRRKGEALPPAIGELAWYWFVRYDTGVRPRLPERDELIDGETLRRSADVLLEETLLFLRASRPSADTLPAEIAHMNEDLLARLGHGRIPVPFLSKVWEAYVQDILPEYGRVAYDPIEDYSMWYEEDRIQIDRFSAPFFSRKALRVPSRSVEQTLNHLGIPAIYDEDAPVDMVSIKGLREADDAPHVALAEGIWVRGIGPIPYLIKHVGDDETEFAVGENGNRMGLYELFIFAGSAEGAVRLLEKSPQTFAEILVLDEVLREGKSDWINSDEDGGISPAAGGVIEFLIGEIADAFEPSRAEATRRYFRFQELARKAGEEIDRLRELGKEAGPARGEVAKALRHVKGALRILSAQGRKAGAKGLLAGK